MWNTENKPTGFLSSFTKAPMLTHRKEGEKDKQVFPQSHDGVIGVWLILPAYTIRKLYKINNSFQILDNSQSRSEIPKKRGEMRWGLQMPPHHTLKAVYSMQCRERDLQQSREVSENWGNRDSCSGRPRHPEFVGKQTREKGIAFGDRALEICRDGPSSHWQVLICHVLRGKYLRLEKGLLENK